MIARGEPSPYGDLVIHYTTITTTLEEARRLAFEDDRPRLLSQDESATDLCIEVVTVAEKLEDETA